MYVAKLDHSNLAHVAAIWYIKKSRQTRNEMDRRHEETSKEPMGKNYEVQERLVEINYLLKVAVQVRKWKLR